MALQEVTNTLSRRSGDRSSPTGSLNKAASNDSSPSSSTSSSTGTSDSSRPSDAHPWAGGKKVLKPVEEGEKMRSLRLRKKSGLDDLTQAALELNIGENETEQPLSPRQAYLCTADLIDANDRLREELMKVYAGRDETLVLLDGLRQSHAVVCSQLEAARNELASQEDELFVLREMHEEHGKEIAELRKAKEFAEVETQTASQLGELREEIVRLKEQVRDAQQELEEAKRTQTEQQEACMELLEEQKKLEEAYDEAVAQLDSWRGHHAVEEESQGEASPSSPNALLPFAADQDPLDDVSQEWEKVEVGDASATPPRKSKSTGRKGATRFLSKRRRTPSQPLFFNFTAPQGDVQLVKNDVEQLKQTIALLVKERGTSFDGQRSSMDVNQA
ncbi:hypothetical protein JCM6882_001428 [Rhodosporidiobolus microsporus]